MAVNAVQKVVDAVVLNRAHQATKYISPKLIVRATRVLTRGKVPNEPTINLMVTVGRPNFAERKFIADCRSAGEKFPIRKVQLKFPPKRKAA